MRNPIFEDELISRRERLWRLANTELPPLKSCIGFVAALLLQWFCGYVYVYSVCGKFPESPVDARPATNEAVCLKAVTAALAKKQTGR